jgi:Histidine kinase-, DNA gyrase B-, and HSP90-like ATPase
MTLSLSVLDHLGLNLYSSIPAVLSEVVANAWDADATHVTIAIDATNQAIQVSDDGSGMSAQAINDRYLNVGYRRREQQGVITPVYGRHVMGRKGIGKLSLFSIAEEIEVWSAVPVSDGTERSGLILRTEDIRAQIKSDAAGPYHPEAVSPSKIGLEVGTKIVLRKLRSRASQLTESALRTRLARRFNLNKTNFSVVVNKTPIGLEDRQYFKNVEYLWSLGDVGDDYEQMATSAKKKMRVDGIVDGSRGWIVSGWIGTFDEQKSIKAEEGLNSVPVLAWRKLVHENILDDIKEGGLFTKYLSGELHADFVDLDDQPDIATSDRQHLKEDDERYRKLVEFVQQKLLREIGNKWRDWRNADAINKARQASPAVQEWFDSLNPDERKSAEALFGKLGSLGLEREEERSQIYRNTIIAFERLRLNQQLHRIQELPDGADFAILEPLFLGIDEVEAAEYHRIAEGRMQIIRSFEKLVPDSKERAIQKYLFEHLWLMDPSWERAAVADKRIEQAVTKEFDKITTKELTVEEKKGRIDIRLRTSAGRHIIIELKKASAHPDYYRLFAQMSKYRNALERVLKAYGSANPYVEIVAVVGTPVAGPPAPQMDQQLASINGQIVTYDALITAALARYQQYLEADERVSKLKAILDRL